MQESDSEDPAAANSSLSNFSNLKIREAKPEDAGQIAPLIYRTDPVTFNFEYGNKKESVLSYISYSFRQKKSFFSFQKTKVVADRYDRVAGLVVAFDYNFSARAILQEYKTYLGWAGMFKTLSFLHREAVVNRYWILPDKDSLYIAFYSIAPRWQGTGLSRYLFNEALNMAKNQGYKKVELDVNIDNEKAKNLYFKMGFQIKQILRYEELENRYKIPSTQVMLKYLW